MLESFRKQPFLIPTRVGTAFWCVVGRRRRKPGTVRGRGLQESPGAAFFRLEGSSLYDLLLYFSLLPSRFMTGQRTISRGKLETFQSSL